MATNDTAALVVALSAQLSKFEKDMNGAGDIADRTVRRIEQRFSSINITAGKLLGATALGSALGTAFADPIQFAINKAKELGDEFTKTAGIAKLLQLSIERVQEISFAFQLGGGSFDQFRSGSEQFLRNAEEAKRALDEVGTLSSKQINRVENDFARLFKANGVALTDASGKLLTFDELLFRAADLIKNAKTELDKVRLVEILGLGREWVRVLEKGGPAFRAAADSAAEAGGVIDKETIQRAKDFDRAWDRSAVLLKAAFKGALVDIRDGFSDLWERLADQGVWGFLERKFGEIFGGLASKTSKQLRTMLTAAVDPAEIERIEEEIAFRIARARRRAAEETPPTPPGESPSGGAGASPASGGDKSTVIPFKLKNKETELDKEIKATEKHIAVTDAETKAIDLGTFAREKEQITAKLLTTAEQAGLTVTDQMRAKIDEVSSAYGRAAVAIENARSPLATFARESANVGKQLNQFAATSLDTMTNELANVVTGTKSAADAFRAMAQSILNDLAKIAIRKGITGPIAEGLFGSLGGVGGLFGVGGRAAGGPVSAGQPYIVGEEGRPELFVPNVNGTIVPTVPNQIKSGSSFGGGSMAINVTVDVSGANGDAAIAQIAARATAQGVQEGLSQYDSALPGRLHSIRLRGL